MAAFAAATRVARSEAGGEGAEGLSADSLAVLLTAAEPRIDVTSLGTIAGALSQREHEVAALVAEGLSNPEIADRLTLSVRTVENHIYRAMRKAEVGSRRQLGIVVALTNGERGASFGERGRRAPAPPMR